MKGGIAVINMNKLKGKMVEKDVTTEMLAEKLGMSRSTLYRKLSNNGDTLFVKEANIIVTRLDLLPKKQCLFFSASLSHDMRLKRKED